MAQCLSHRNNYLVNHLRDIVKVDETFLDSPISDADFLDGIATVNSARVPKINRQEVFMLYILRQLLAAQPLHGTKCAPHDLHLFIPKIYEVPH
jgi:hypothetical protein